jgi:predicted ATPase
MKKILFTGTPSSGKTTVWEFLKNQHLPDVVFIEAITSQLVDKYLGIEQNPEFQALLFAEQVKHEQQIAQSRPQYIFCDRGSIDIIAHARLSHQPIHPEWADWTQTYDFALYFDSTDLFFKLNNQLDKALRQSLEECCLPYHVIKGNDREKEVQTLSLLWPDSSILPATPYTTHIPSR